MMGSFTTGTMQNFCLWLGSLSANVTSGNVIFALDYVISGLDHFFDRAVGHKLREANFIMNVTEVFVELSTICRSFWNLLEVKFQYFLLQVVQTIKWMF